MSHEYYFDHHRIEATRNLGRLRLGLAAIVVATVGVCAPAFFSRASGETNYVDGAKILNASGSTSGAFAAAKVTARQVATGYTETSTDNPFTFATLPASSANGGDSYVISVAAPSGYTVKGVTWCLDDCAGYDPQTTNFAAGASITSKIYSTHDYHMSWIFQAASTPSATPTPARTATPRPVATPTPVPAKTPAPPAGATPKPTSSTVKSPGSGSGSTSPTTPVDPGTPSAPGSFEAIVTGENSLITLTWAASSDTLGIAGYRMERSSDNATWTELNAHITGLNFLDDKAAFGVLYNYRISATSVSGRTSGYSIVSAKTGNFVANSVASAGSSYTSSDRVATVEVPPGALSADASCSLMPALFKAEVSGRVVVAGPYSLICKNAAGTVLSDFLKPIKWSFALKTKLAGYKNPSAVGVDSAGGRVDVPNATYDAIAQTLKFNQTMSGSIAIVASARMVVPYGLIITLGAIGLLVVVGLTLFWRKAQREKYFDHLRAKYYNL